VDLRSRHGRRHGDHRRRRDGQRLGTALQRPAGVSPKVADARQLADTSGDVDPGTDTTVRKTLCGFNENLLNQLVSDQTTIGPSDSTAIFRRSWNSNVDGVYYKSTTLAIVLPAQRNGAQSPHRPAVAGGTSTLQHHRPLPARSPTRFAGFRMYRRHN
jgi:hypothetical protein